MKSQTGLVDAKRIKELLKPLKDNVLKLLLALGASEDDIRLVEGQNNISNLYQIFYSMQWSEARKKVPKEVDAVIKTILQTPEILQNVVFSTFTFTEFIENFPEYFSTLLNKVFENPGLANKVINSERDLLLLGKLYPDWSDVLLDKVLEDPTLRSNVIKTRYHLEQIMKRYPHKSEDLIKHTKILECAEVFWRFLRQSCDLFPMLRLFPNHVEAILDRVLENRVEESEMHCEIIRNTTILVGLVRDYPDKTEDLIKHTKILEGPRAFRSLADSEYLGGIRGFSGRAEYCLRLLAKAFPGYDAFKKPTVAEAFLRFKEERASTIEIQAAAVVIAQGERDTNTPFQRLPRHINNYIAGFFGTHGVSDGGKVRRAMQDARGKIEQLRR